MNTFCFVNSLPLQPVFPLLYPLLFKDEEFTQPVHLPAQYKADTRLGYLAIKYAFIIFIMEYPDITGARSIKAVFQRYIVDERLRIVCRRWGS